MDGDRKHLYLWRMIRINSAPQFHRCEPHWRWGPISLKDHDLWYVLDGAGTVGLNGRDHAVCAYTCFVFAPGSQITAQHDPTQRLRVFAVHFDHPPSEPPSGAVKVRDAAFFGALARRCAAAYLIGTEMTRRQSAELVEQMLLHLCAEAEEQEITPIDSRLGEIVDRIQEDPGRRWLVTELARKANLSRSQFARRFAAMTGLAPEKFMITARIDRAKQLLRESEMTVGQIADALGYQDVYFFSRQFAQVIATPPSDYRKEQRSGGR